jgi:putative NADPH-quinone reductase
LSEAASQAEVLVLLGSARSDGDTAKAAAAFASELAPLTSTLVDLKSRRIASFDYSDPQQDYDFSELADLMIAHRSIVFATPVYWYAMSGPMKTLFDRLSDLLSDRDPARRGRSLGGRDVWMLAVGTDPALPDGFERPFEMTAHYLDMRWRGGCYVRTRGAVDFSPLRQLAAELKSATPAAP